MSIICNEEERRALVRDHRNAEGKQDVYGMDYIDVSPDQLTLTVHFIGKLPPVLREENRKLLTRVRIEGGERIKNIKVTHVTPRHDSDPQHDDSIQVRVDRPGDFSTYRLRLLDVPDLDPRLSSLEFSFKVACPSDLDCVPATSCPPRVYDEPEINYLAKDYASFRQLILDRLALLLPGWKENHIPDFGITLVELLAYIGDYLSYYQDAVSTEAYLDTARRRISVRRHARLVDYMMHEGHNARAWVYLQVRQVVQFKPEEVAFIAGIRGLVPENQAFVAASRLTKFPMGSYEVFEPLARDPSLQIELYPEHNEIEFYTWGERECCLPVGTTRATLLDYWNVPAEQAVAAVQEPEHQKGHRHKRKHLPPPAPIPSHYERKLKLKAGDLVLLEEVVGPKTGAEADADPGHRQVVRLTHVEAKQDRLFPESHNFPTPVLEIEWANEDALSFPLCLSSVTQAPDCSYIPKVSVVRGNLILVGQGQTIDEDLGVVQLSETVQACDCEGHPAEVELVAAPFTPTLKRTPLVFSEPVTWTGPAKQMLVQDAQRAVPNIWVKSQVEDQVSSRWEVAPDLLGSGSDTPNFVVEMDDDRTAHLRFGDGDLGLAPPANAVFGARYRIALSDSIEFPAGSITHMTRDRGILDGITQIRNPLAASPAVPPQALREAKLLAPWAFKQEIRRAITGDDYANISRRELDKWIQRAATNLTWTGSWYEADVALDPLGSEAASPALLERGEDALEPFRRTGHDLRVGPATYVPIEIGLCIIVDPDYLRGHVEAALFDVFSNRALPGGRSGMFYPDNLTFGQSIYLSQIVAAAQAVQGVQSAQVYKLQRLYDSPNNELEQGYLPLGPLEIARLDNDPSFPEHGRLTLDMRGGR